LVFKAIRSRNYDNGGGSFSHTPTTTGINIMFTALIWNVVDTVDVVVCILCRPSRILLSVRTRQPASMFGRLGLVRGRFVDLLSRLSRAISQMNDISIGIPSPPVFLVDVKIWFHPTHEINKFSGVIDSIEKTS
jgi:hypothetical protein